MRIALDAMGGDFAPQPNIEGALAAVEADPDLTVILVGDRLVIERELERAGYSGSRIEIKEADSVVGMEEKPTRALREKPNSSIAVSWRTMAEGEASAVVSAGNTGAVVAAGLRTRLFLSGVKRPGIAAVVPTMKGHCILTDVGANPAARADHLYQYGVMGKVVARELLGVENPRVGLINIGSEDGKGNDLYQQAHKFLSESSLGDDYVGNVEGRGLYQGEADVLLCDGFVGNVVLKVSEGMADFLLKSMSQSVLSELDHERDRARRAFVNTGKRWQYHEHGGAPLLGIDGVCMICHGSSDARCIENALKAARDWEDKQINPQITSELATEAARA